MTFFDVSARGLAVRGPFTPTPRAAASSARDRAPMESPPEAERVRHFRFIVSIHSLSLADRP